MQAAVHFPQIEGDSSKLQKVQAIVQHFSQQFQEYYVPEQQVSIDESLIGFEGRGPAIQYMPNKHHHRFGIKLFCLCESSTGYTYSFSIYESKNKNFSEHGLSHDICVDLMEPLLDMGYHLYTDNWYTAIPLAEFLSSRNTNIAGTVRANRKFLPAGVKQKLPKGDPVAFRKNNLLCIGWHDKKHVILLSKEGLSKMITYTSKRNREHTMRELVRDYNLYMGGVDLSDMRTYIFLDERRTIKWNKKVFFTLLGRLLLNSFILYQCNGDLPKLDRQKFMVKVVEGLIGGFREQRSRPGPKIKDAPNRLLNPEKHFKQTKLEKGKKKNCCLHKVARQHSCSHFVHLWRVQCCTMYWRILGEISHKESFMTTYKNIFCLLLSQQCVFIIVF